MQNVNDQDGKKPSVFTSLREPQQREQTRYLKIAHQYYFVFKKYTSKLNASSFQVTEVKNSSWD